MIIIAWFDIIVRFNGEYFTKLLPYSVHLFYNPLLLLLGLIVRPFHTINRTLMMRVTHFQVVRRHIKYELWIAFDIRLMTRLEFQFNYLKFLLLLLLPLLRLWMLEHAFATASGRSLSSTVIRRPTLDVVDLRGGTATGNNFDDKSGGRGAAAAAIALNNRRTVS